MNTTQLIGEVGFREQPPETGFQSGRGWFCTRKWTGARSGIIGFIVAGLPPFYSDLRIDEEGEKATVVASYGITGPEGSQISDPISVVWTMPNNESDEPLSSLPEIEDVFLSIGEASSVALAAEIDDGIQNHTRMDKIDWESFLLTSDQLATMQSYYARRMWGIDTVRLSQYVLRKVQTVIAESQVKAAHDNVNKILTYAQLTASEPTLPAASLIEPAGLTNYFWWKKTPVVDSSARGQFQIAQEYWGTTTKDRFIYKGAV